MKKIIKILGLVLGLFLSKMQAQGNLNFGDFSKPVPSVSSLSTYINNPISIASGIPDISVPITKIPTADKSLTMEVALSYHVGNVNRNEAAGETGIGWSLLKGAVISREIKGEIDEFYDDASASEYQKNEFDDIYYYNLPGVSGKFRVKRNITTNTFSIENLSPNTVKFEYTRENNTATLFFSSFTITDQRGYKYYFNDYSVATKSVGLHGLNIRKEYKSAFFVSKITDHNNVELLTFTYQKDSKNIPNTTKLSFKSCKLKTIVSKDIGTIGINYNYSELTGAMNDPYSVSEITLKDKNGILIEKYLFNYSQADYSFPSPYSSYDEPAGAKRILTEIQKTDRTALVTEKTSFIYDSQGSTTDYRPSTDQSSFGDSFCSTPIIDPAKRTLGTLRAIIFPTKGMVEYIYEANQTHADKNNPYYYGTTDERALLDPETQYIKKRSTTEYDTRQRRDYTFNVTTSAPGISKVLYISFGVDEIYTSQANGQDPITGPDNQLFVDYYLVIDGRREDPVKCQFNVYSDFKMVSLAAGTYTLRVVGTGGRGRFSIYEIETLPPPYKNVSTVQNLGIRIKNIIHYDHPIYWNSKKTIEYEYADFSNPLNASSGGVFTKENNGDPVASLSRFMLYKNVKVKESGNGYIQYYFKLPHEYSTGNAGSMSFYNLTKQGVLNKVETYNSQGQLLASKTFEYTFENIANGPEYNIDFQTTTHPAWVKQDKMTEKLYQAGTSKFVESSVENYYHPSNYQLASSIRKNSDGETTENFIKYAVDKGNTSLLNANMVTIPLETESRNNGKTMGKTETKFENPSLLLPSSQVVINPNDNSSKTVMRYDHYDSKGNLVQYTVDPDNNGSGNSVTLIWGYNQTLPIARIEGAKLSDIGSLADESIAKSNADADAASETALIDALDAFRTNPALQNFVVTTYTYDPLVGITTITPPTGIREIYRYDLNNTLKSVTDVNGNIITEYKYNTKPQL